MKDLQQQDETVNIGSFRNNVDIQKHLPEALWKEIFDEIPNNLDPRTLISVNPKKAVLNNGAFGHAYDSVRKLSSMLREFSESEPDVFYDQICLPLVNHSYITVEKFFDTENVVIVPNCTSGMKCVADLLFRTQKNENVAYLVPLYGATAKLLKYYEGENLISSLAEISPGENPLVEEDGDVFLRALNDAFNMQQFTVLFCDEIASQSGRVLPINEIAGFCEARNIKLVVDGTQSCLLFFGNKKDVLKKIDYFVMSTHKWIGNTKTCGIIRYKDRAPMPPAISFGWEADTKTHPSKEKIRAQFTWQGMLDSYVSYITLSKAIKIFSKYGEEQFYHASKLLRRGLSEYLKVLPLLPRNKERVMNIFELECSSLVSMKDNTAIQNALQDYGILISVKKVGKDCGGIIVDGQRVLDTRGSLIKGGGDQSEISRSARACSLKPKPLYYLRISAWSFNKEDDFETLSFVFNNNLRLSTTTDAGLRQQFVFIYDLYEKLFSTLTTKAYFIRAERLRHHLIFYFGHTAVFYVNKLVAAGYLNPSHRFDPRLESSMSVGVDEMSWDDLLEDNYDWSGLDDAGLVVFLEKVREYRIWVRKLVLKLIDTNPIENPICQGDLAWVLMMGIEHEKIHLETSAVIISQVPIDFIKSKHNFNIPTYWKGKKYMSPENEQLNEIPQNSQLSSNQLVPIPGGTVVLGKPHMDSDLYGWDNEFGSERKDLEAFEASQMLVSNTEYLQFVNSGGYTEAGHKWWSKEGWRYVTDLKVTGPRFWIKGHKYYRAMLEEIPMPWNLPVEVNNLEAEAFCNWKSEQLGKRVRLISHEESVHMRTISTAESANLNLHKYASPTPVNLYGGMINGRKVYDVSGNVWRHSVSVLTVMNGFKTDPIYTDFTLPTIDGYHNAIVGGSWISVGNCANVSGRYGFRRHFYQYAGIRYVCSENTYHDRVLKMFDEVKTTRHITENYSVFLAETLVEKKPVPNWPKLLGQRAANVVNKECEGKALKVFVAYGGIGRVTLELLRGCKNLNIDHSDTTANTLQVLEHLLKESRIKWYQQVEGDIYEGLSYHFEDSETPVSLLRDKNNHISYWQVDYKNIRSQLDDYDVIVADVRHKDGGDELGHMVKKLKTGGLLILGSIDDTRDGVQINDKHSLVVLQTLFQRVQGVSTEEYPHMYRETRNKHQYAISYLSAWKKLSSESTKDATDFDIIPSSSDVTNATDYYEDSHILKSYDAFHFGEGLLSVKNFPLRMAEVAIEMCKKYGTQFKTALDAGCGPGRTAIELCSVFDQVEGYDYSHGFINMMKEEQKKRNLTNLIAHQGDGHKQMEECQLKKYDLIIGCNLIDRLHSPELWLQQSKGMLNPDGVLIVSSPYTWKAEHTAPEKWIGGLKKYGEDTYTVDGLRARLAPELVLLEELKVPFVIPDADGTYQYTYSNCTVFGAPSKR